MSSIRLLMDRDGGKLWGEFCIGLRSENGGGVEIGGGVGISSGVNIGGVAIRGRVSMGGVAVRGGVETLYMFSKRRSCCVQARGWAREFCV
jgi:hypothetical protein